jgi:hypothetical protein
MRHYLALLVLLTFFFIFGCSENSSLVNPVTDSNNLEWINFQSNSLAKHSTDLVFTKLIDPAKGGKIKIKVKDDISIKGELKVPKNSFVSDTGDPVEFAVDLTVLGTIIFTPSDTDFDPSLTFSIMYKGVELDNWEGIKFAYIDENNVIVEVVDQAEVIVNEEKGILGVKNVKIDHFSRYGFIK